MRFPRLRLPRPSLSLEWLGGWNGRLIYVFGSGGHSNIQNLETRTGDNRAHIDLTLDIVDLEHLEKIISLLRKIEGVYEVERVMHP